MPENTDRPTPRVAVYGTPQQVAILLASMIRLVNAEPDETFNDGEVRIEANKALTVLRDRLDLPTTWQEANPGRCCACDGSLTSYSAEWKPLCVPCGSILTDGR